MKKNSALVVAQQPQHEHQSPAMTRLPPSPEIPALLTNGRLIMPELSLDGTVSRNNGVSGNLHSTITTPLANGNATTTTTGRTTRTGTTTTTANHSHNNNNNTRLRSVAKYQSFHPQALACSDEILSTSYSDLESSLDFGGPSSLGAIAGPRGIALFRLSRPHIPLLIFSHATTTSYSNNNNKRGTISSLAFRPSRTMADPTSSSGDSGGGSSNGGSSTPLYLAAARGAGVLLWDASGRSNNPLVGRLVVEDGVTDPSSSSSSSVITSMSWKPSYGQPLLATTTASALSLWDIRSHQSSGGFKPSLRFGATRDPSQQQHPYHHHHHHQSLFSPLVQVACSSNSDECATIDASGIVRIYDLRMTERGRAYMGSPLAAFVAHEGGAGILHMEQWETNHDSVHTNQRLFRENASTNSPNTISGSAWVTWGLDSLSSSAVVKVWADRSSSLLVENLSNVSADDDWDIGGTAGGVGAATGGGPDVEGGPPSLTRPNTVPTTNHGPDYHVIAKCTRSNLACARVGTVPVRNSLVVVGYVEGQQSVDVDGNVTGIPQTGWWAELLTVRPPTVTEEGRDGQRPTDSAHNFGLTQVTKFHGGVANADADSKSLLTVLGNTPVGRLQAAELAFSFARTTTTTMLEDGTDICERTNASGIELLLCSLTDTGVLTTHGIPEAFPKPSQAESVVVRPIHTGLGRTSSSIGSNGVRTPTQAAIFLESNEGNSLVDVAGVWSGNTLGSGMDASWTNGNEVARFSQRAVSPQKALHMQTDDPVWKASRLADGGGPMPFHMEADTQQSVPVAYGTVSSGNITTIQVGITDMSSTGGSNSGKEEVEAQIRDSSSIMENIETHRVPCPRLCGATFGSGNGGLVIFKNGEVKKMWDWYQKTDTIRLSSVPGGQLDPTTASPSNPDSLAAVEGVPLGLAKPSSDSVTHAVSSGPRTLKELVDMVTTAKEAQWGEGNVGSAEDDTMSVLDDFFEDESLESISDESGDDDDDDDGGQPTDEIYKRYFGGKAWKATVERSSHRAPTTRNQTIISSMLSPVVNVHHSFDGILLNGQNVQLATRWKLGPWDNSEACWGETKSDESIEVGFDNSKGQLPHYRDLVPVTPREGPAFSRIRSDPNLNSRIRSPSNIHANRHSTSGRDLDEPVHGGEYSVRPNMEESMTFLKKLFSHHQESGTTFPTLLSPPDNPVLMNQRVSSRKSRPESGRPLEKRTLDIHKMNSADLGVHTLKLPGDDEKRPFLEKLEETCRLCLHNAQVSKECGSVEKEDVWNLLADMVENQMDDEGKLFNGWGGKGGGALGVEMVANFFQFYEAIGDIQMLATMYCVLNGGHDRIKDVHHLNLLPHGRVYDNYIKRYAELLYAWGLLNVRAELNKHLTRKQTEFDFLCMEGNNGNGTPRTLGVGLSCPRCSGEVDPGTNVCLRCRDWAFRCSICDNAVRGLFTFCDYCHHGGHLQHLVNWFSSNSYCATGCGCQCSFTPTVHPPESDISRHDVSTATLPYKQRL